VEVSAAVRFQRAAFILAVLSIRVFGKQQLTNILHVIMETSVITDAIFRLESVEAVLYVTVIVILIEQPAPSVTRIIGGIPENNKQSLYHSQLRDQMGEVGNKKVAKPRKYF